MDAITVRLGDFTDEQLAVLASQSDVRIETADGRSFIFAADWITQLRDELTSITADSACRI